MANVDDATEVTPLPRDRAGAKETEGPGKPHRSARNRSEIRIALVTPYTGGNFGDAAIQDSMIENLRLRLPGAQFSGISLNSENYLKRHGSRAFSLCAAGNSFYGMSGATAHVDQMQPASIFGRLLRKLPGARWYLKTLQPFAGAVSAEIRHWREGRRFLRDHDAVIVCGGGQLDEEWGGPWGHPYALYKWSVLARRAGIPFVIASVGACKTSSKMTHFFLKRALWAATYRSYRDENSRQIAALLFSEAAKDGAVPDLAFGVVETPVAGAGKLRAAAQGRKIVAISPIAYAKPGAWPFADEKLHRQYLRELAAAASELLKTGHFVVFVWSASGDRAILSELLALLDEEAKGLLPSRAAVPELGSWKDLLNVLVECDFLVASRLHSTIFGFLAQTPVVAISFDAKVDWAMQDLAQRDALLRIRDFTAQDVLGTLARLSERHTETKEQFAAYRRRVSKDLATQFDTLAQIAAAKASQSN